MFDLTGVGSRICNGLDDIKSFMESEAAHPRTHMMTNIYADSGEEGVTLCFRIVALLGKGLASTASYYDTLVKTDNGWRTQHRYVSVAAGTNVMPRLIARASRVNSLALSNAWDSSLS